jgi:hypothetical protein
MLVSIVGSEDAVVDPTGSFRSATICVFVEDSDAICIDPAGVVVVAAGSDGIMATGVCG